MGEQSTGQDIKALLSGRWQIPVALAAALAAGVALYRLIPEPPRIQFDSVLADIALLEQSGDLVAAADATANLLEMEPPLPEGQRAVLHGRLADLVYQAELESPVHHAKNVEQILAHDERAAALGHEVTPRARLRRAQAQRWLGRTDEALASFSEALEGDLSGDDRRTAVRSLVDLLERRPEGRLQRQALLEQVLADESVGAAHVWWALQRSVQDALDQQDTQRAHQLLDAYGPRLTNSDLNGYLDHLRATIMLHEGRAQEAEPVVRWVDDWLGTQVRTTAALDNYGHLPSLNRWLLGRIHLAEKRPQEALRAFETALAWDPSPRLKIAAAAGQGRALGALQRHSAARRALQSAADALLGLPSYEEATVDVFQETLLDLSTQQEKVGDYDNALAYLEMAADLTPRAWRGRRLKLYEQLGDLARLAGRQTADPAVQRAYHERAGRAFEQASKLVHRDEEQLASLLWSAAEEYDEAGRLGGVRRMLERFVPGRGSHPRMPQALLMLGQAYEGYGDLEQALEWYGRVAQEHPRLAEAGQARVLRARSLLSLGPERYDEAERELVSLLSDGTVAPAATVYRQGLLTLSELLYDQQRYAESIARLEEFLTLYPKDSARQRAQFMLANAHRRSALVLREGSGTASGTPAERALESDARLANAAELYERLLEDLQNEPAADESAALYTRLALFYRGDCLYALNERDTLREALTVYRNAAARYEGEPAALTAHVQIANIHLRLGDLPEAARALERARWLLDAIPDDAYARAQSGSRAEWEQYLATVLSSELFAGVSLAAN
jgi:tetratricopeptide (TPR) repeat protein